jgi:hypothetical protein
MSTTRDVRPFEPGGQRRKLVRLVRQIHALTLEVRDSSSVTDAPRSSTPRSALSSSCAGDWPPPPDAPQPTISTPPRDNRRGIDDRTTAAPLRSWLSVRHSLRAEAVVTLAPYGLYEC